MPQTVTFLCNVIIPRLTLTSDEFEDIKLIKISFRIGSKKFDITSSRINVSDFQHNGVVELKGDTAGMRTQMAAELGMQIRFKGRVIGDAFVKFPEEFLNKIDTKMGDTVQSEVVPIVFLGENVGELEFMITLTVKCEEPAPDADPEWVTMGGIISISC